MQTASHHGSRQEGMNNINSIKSGVPPEIEQELGKAVPSFPTV